MRSGWKRLGLLAFSVLGLVFAPGSANAQFGPMGGGFGPPEMPAPPGGGGPGAKDPPFTMKDDGRPNAFSSIMDIRSRDYQPILPRFLVRPLEQLRPGFLRPSLTPAVAAEFPNPAQESNEPVSPFTMREEGVSNAFTELRDPRPRGALGQILGGTRLLYTELFDPPPQIYPPHVLNLRGEFLLWRVPNGPIGVPLVTTTANPTIAGFGQMGNPDTVILLNSGNVIDYGTIPGYRLSAEVTTIHTPPIEVSGFSFTRTQTVFSGGSLTNPTQLLSMPYQDVDPKFIIPGTTNYGLESAALVAIPVGSALGAQGGTINITSNMNLWGIDANVYLPIGESDVLGLRLFGGYKHLSLREKLTIGTQSGGSVGGTQFNGFRFPDGIFMNSTTDTFETTNSFDGGQFGIKAALNLQRWSLITDASVGIGRSNHDLSVGGVTNLIPLLPNRVGQTANGGIFALPSNSGTFSTAATSVTFETKIALSFQLSPNCRLYSGFNYLYWNTIARPGDYVTNIIDARQIPTSGSFQSGVTYNGPAPVGTIIRRDLTVTGLFLGLEIGF